MIFFRKKTRLFSIFVYKRVNLSEVTMVPFSIACIVPQIAYPRSMADMTIIPLLGYVFTLSVIISAKKEGKGWECGTLCVGD